jgi:tetratricopeptide (TPR) repeat protein
MTPAPMPRSDEATRPPRLSLCLVVKDEEAFIGRCLEQMRGLADEVLVLDTGSTDRTIAIAEAHGARVYPFVWCDDFAAARNELLQHVTGDWILMLDADMLVDPDSHDAIRRLMQAPTPNVYGFPLLQCRDAAGTRWYPDYNYVWRLYPNRLGLRYHGCIHESLQLPERGVALHPVDEGVKIYHYGYLAAQVVSKHKSERDYRLLSRRVCDQPPNPHMYWLLGRVAYRLGRHAEAERELRHALDLWSGGAEPPASAADRAGTQVDLARALLDQARPAAAAACCAQAMVDAPDLTEAHHLQAEILRRQGDVPGALAAYMRALSCHDDAARYEAVERWEILRAIAEMHRAQGGWAAAQQMLEAAHALQPTEPCLLLDLADLARARGDAAAEDAYVRRALGGPEPSAEAWQHLAGLYLERGAAGAAEATLRRGLQQHATAHGLHRALARLLASQGRLAEAIPHWTRSVGARPNVHPTAVSPIGGPASG